MRYLWGIAVNLSVGAFLCAALLALVGFLAMMVVFAVGAIVTVGSV